MRIADLAVSMVPAAACFSWYNGSGPLSFAIVSVYVAVWYGWLRWIDRIPEWKDRSELKREWKRKLSRGIRKQL